MTRQPFGQLLNGNNSLPDDVRAELQRLVAQYNFFHWHIEFPHVFTVPDNGDQPANKQAGWSGGFDVVLGNPPWERIKLQETEWFAARNSDIATAPNAAARSRLIDDLRQADPRLHAAFLEARRIAEGESHLVRNSRRFPLCGRGDINTYSIFAETMRMIMQPSGRIGCIVPSGIATDDTTKFFFQDLITSRAVVSLYDFENRKRLFPAVDSRVKFSLLTLTGPSSPADAGADFVFFALDVEDLKDQDKHFTLTADDIALLNPNTGTCAIFRSRRDAEITKAIYRRVPVLIKEGAPESNPWGVRFATMFHMANDSGLFRTLSELQKDGFQLQGNVFVRDSDSQVERYLPLYEAKMIHQFDHRWATYDYSRKTAKEMPEVRDVTDEEKQDPNFVVMPRYWVPESEVQSRLAGKWNHPWLLGWRDITNSTNERTVIASIMPLAAVGHTCPIMLFPETTADKACVLLANLSSFVLDYCCRQKIGGTHLTYGYLNQLPVLPPAAYVQPCPWDELATLLDWVRRRALKLICSTPDLATSLSGSLDDLQWDPQLRAELRAELDAAFFLLYGLSADDVDFVMETFPIVKGADLASSGRFMTKDKILDSYERLARSSNLAASPSYASISSSKEKS